MTKHVHDELKCHLTVEDTKVTPQILDNTLVISAPSVMCKPKRKVKVRVVKAKVSTIKKTSLEKATSNLYDLEDCTGPEKPLNIDFGLYQMEDY